MAGIECYPELGIGQRFLNNTFNLDQIFFSHRKCIVLIHFNSRRKVMLSKSLARRR